MHIFFKGGRQWIKSQSSKYHQIWYTRLTSVDYPSLAFVATVEAILVVFQTCRYTHASFIQMLLLLWRMRCTQRHVARARASDSRPNMQDPTSRDIYAHCALPRPKRPDCWFERAPVLGHVRTLPLYVYTYIPDTEPPLPL